MNFFKGPRIPLSETRFTDARAARFYDEHARRFMTPVYRKFAIQAAGIAPGKQILDIGAGSGCLAIELAKILPGRRVTGIDVSEDMLKIARENTARSGLAERIEFRRASATELPFPDDCFDLIVSNTSLHLWAEPLKVFKEIKRTVVPGGYCFIWDNVRMSALNPLLSFIGRCMGMNAAQRRLWMEALRSSYTPGEAKALLKQSTLKGARVKFIPGFFMMKIEWRKE